MRVIRYQIKKGTAGEALTQPASHAFGLLRNGVKGLRRSYLPIRECRVKKRKIMPEVPTMHVHITCHPVIPLGHIQDR